MEASGSDSSARLTAEGADNAIAVDALLTASRRGPYAALDSSAGPDVATLATQVPPSGPSTERGAMVRRPKAAGPETAACVPNRGHRSSANSG